MQAKLKKKVLLDFGRLQIFYFQRKQRFILNSQKFFCEIQTSQA